MTNPSQQPSEVEELRSRVKCVLGYCEVAHSGICNYESSRNESQELDEIERLFHQHLATEVEKVLSNIENNVHNAPNRERVGAYVIDGDDFRWAIHQERNKLKGGK